jgi:translation initiation factor IF-1
MIIGFYFIEEWLTTIHLGGKMRKKWVRMGRADIIL